MIRSSPVPVPARTLYNSGNFATLVGGSGQGDVLVAGGYGGSFDAGGAGDFGYERGAGDSGYGSGPLGAGSNNDWINIGAYGGYGANSMSGAGAHDLLVAGSGAGATLYDSGDFGTLVGGSGQGDVLIAEGRGDLIDAGGAGNSGHGSGTLVAGGNNDQIDIGAYGNDTVIGSGSGWGWGWGSGNGDDVLFVSQAYGTGSGITINTAHDGVTTVSFADIGQHFSISGIQTLTFSDGHVVHLGGHL